MSRFFVSIIAFIGCFYLANAAKRNLRKLDEFAEEDYQSFFTEEWQKEYTHKQLAGQPKWALTENQPEHAKYEVREYAPAWWVTSYTPCYDLVNATQMGYLQLYMYMQFGLNSKFTNYDLTYPILTKLELGSSKMADHKEGGMRRNPCPDKFSVNLHMPYYPAGDDDIYNDPSEGFDQSITTSETLTIRRYVRTYDDKFTSNSPKVCREQAVELASDLLIDGKEINLDTYFCAMYDYDKNGGIRFEIWYDEDNQ